MRLRTPGTIAVAGAIAVAGCNSDPEPTAGGHDGHDASTSISTAAGGNGVDRAFVTAMIPHREGVITMVKVELAKGADPELKALAQDIIDAQERDRGYARLRLRPCRYGIGLHGQPGPLRPLTDLRARGRSSRPAARPTRRAPGPRCTAWAWGGEHTDPRHIKALLDCAQACDATRTPT